MRLVMERAPEAAVHLIGVRPTVAPVALSAKFPITEMEADLLLRIGLEHLAHVAAPPTSRPRSASRSD